MGKKFLASGSGSGYIPRHPLPLINCLICQRPYMPICKTQKYCSPKCSQIAHQQRNLNRVTHQSSTTLSTATVGTISELRVATDLLLKGYEVFRALSPSCSCDLAILKDSKLLKVEVKTGSYYRYDDSGIKLKTSIKRNPVRHDILAIVSPDGIEIKYDSNLPPP